MIWLIHWSVNIKETRVKNVSSGKFHLNSHLVFHNDDFESNDRRQTHLPRIFQENE
jgi:hypothetical protein